jgi:Fur family transcriptional regulator, ferric uptake regulator
LLEPDKRQISERKDPWREYLRKKGLKTTQQREAIVDAFLESSGHINLEELLVSSRAKSPGVGLATVYRTIKLLEEAGLAEARQFGVGQTLYEVAGLDHHDHIICHNCGYIVEYESEEIEAAQVTVARRFGFEIVNHRHEIFGLCDKARGLPGGTCPAELVGKK